jgi:hypothetical protein
LIFITQTQGEPRDVESEFLNVFRWTWDFQAPVPFSEYGVKISVFAVQRLRLIKYQKPKKWLKYVCVFLIDSSYWGT